MFSSYYLRYTGSRSRLFGMKKTSINKVVKGGLNNISFSICNTANNDFFPIKYVLVLVIVRIL